MFYFTPLHILIADPMGPRISLREIRAGSAPKAPTRREASFLRPAVRQTDGLPLGMCEVTVQGLCFAQSERLDAHFVGICCTLQLINHPFISENPPKAGSGYIIGVLKVQRFNKEFYYNKDKQEKRQEKQKKARKRKEIKLKGGVTGNHGFPVKIEFTKPFTDSKSKINNNI